MGEGARNEEATEQIHQAKDDCSVGDGENRTSDPRQVPVPFHAQGKVHGPEGPSEEGGNGHGEVYHAVPGDGGRRDIRGECCQEQGSDRPDGEEVTSPPESTPHDIPGVRGQGEGEQEAKGKRSSVDEVQRHDIAERTYGEVTLCLADRTVMGREGLHGSIQDQIEDQAYQRGGEEEASPSCLGVFFRDDYQGLVLPSSRDLSSLRGNSTGANQHQNHIHYNTGGTSGKNQEPKRCQIAVRPTLMTTHRGSRRTEAPNASYAH